MFEIGLGLLLYKILSFILLPILMVLIVVPFLLNLADGKGYGYNFKKVWHGVLWFLSLGIRKRKP